MKMTHKHDVHFSPHSTEAHSLVMQIADYCNKRGIWYKISESTLGIGIVYGGNVGYVIDADCKDEPFDKDINVRSKDCDTCRNKGFEECEQPCLGCGCCGLYEPKDEPTTQTETQNSNLTFEKDECAKEYEELGLKELKELINADRKTENSSEIPNNCKDEPQTDCSWK